MRPILLFILLAAALPIAACDRTKALDDRARAAVAKAIADQPPADVELLHADAASGTACGAARPKDESVSANAFILRGEVLSFYPGSIGWDTVRQLMNMDSGGDQAALRLRLDDACAFPAVWSATCAPAAAPIAAPDPQMCRLWKAGDYQKLFDHVRQ